MMLPINLGKAGALLEWERYFDRCRAVLGSCPPIYARLSKDRLEALGFTWAAQDCNLKNGMFKYERKMRYGPGPWEFEEE